jgi:hypothetical protein
VREVAVGIVEELLIGDLDGSGMDIWYRNFSTLKKLDLASAFGGDSPAMVKWGANGRGFVVGCSENTFFVFELTDRTDGNKYDENAPGTVALRYSYDATAEEGTLLSVGYTDEIALANWDMILEADVDHYDYTDEKTAADASQSDTINFGVGEVMNATVEDGTGAAGKLTGNVIDWHLNADWELVLVIRVSFTNFWVFTPSKDETTIGRRYADSLPGQTERLDLVVWAGGDTTARPYRLGEFAVEGGGIIVPESHCILWNATTQAVVWSTVDPTVELTHTLNDYSPHPIEIWYRDKTDPAEWMDSVLEDLLSYGNKSEEVGDQRSLGDIGEYQMHRYRSSNETLQLFSPTHTPFMFGGGPYWETKEDTSHYRDSFSICDWTQTSPGGSDGGFGLFSHHQYYHYRVHDALVLSNHLILMVHRVPFPSDKDRVTTAETESAVYQLRLDGTFVRQIRDYQADNFGVEAWNAHRMVWSLGDDLYVTDLETGAEAQFTEAQKAAWVADDVELLLLDPDFLWDRGIQHRFFVAEDLPVAQEDAVILHLAGIQGLPEDAEPMAQATRAVNDEDILSPLGRYLEE